MIKKENFLKWKPFLETLYDKITEEEGTQLSILLENQRVYNELTDMPSKILRTSISLLIRLFMLFKKNDKMDQFKTRMCLDCFPNSLRVNCCINLKLPDGRYCFTTSDEESNEVNKVSEDIYNYLTWYFDSTNKVSTILGLGVDMDNPQKAHLKIFTD